MNKNSILLTSLLSYCIFFFSGCDDDSPAPQVFANFNSDFNTITAGQTVQFTDISVGDLQSWEWTFEGGSPSTSTEQNPTVTYQTAGTYSVCLLVSDGENQDKTTKINFIVVDYNQAGNLVAYYSFDGNANDQSGNGNDGTVNGATLAMDRHGNANSCYSFDGTDDFIEVPHSSSLEFTDAITMSAWVKVDEFNTGTCESSRIFEKGTDGTSGSWGLYYDDNLELNNCGEYNPEKMRFKSGVYTEDGRISYGGTTNIARGYWYHVASTYDGHKFTIYVNGHEESSIILDSAPINNTSSLFIGKQNHSSFPYYMNGSIDEIRIYDRALSEEEINVIKNL